MAEAAAVHSGPHMLGRDNRTTLLPSASHVTITHGRSLPFGGGHRTAHVNTHTHAGPASGHHTPRGASLAPAAALRIRLPGCLRGATGRVSPTAVAAAAAAGLQHSLPRRSAAAKHKEPRSAAHSTAPQHPHSKTHEQLTKPHTCDGSLTQTHATLFLQRNARWEWAWAWAAWRRRTQPTRQTVSLTPS